MGIITDMGTHQIHMDKLTNIDNGLNTSLIIATSNYFIYYYKLLSTN